MMRCHADYVHEEPQGQVHFRLTFDAYPEEREECGPFVRRAYVDDLEAECVGVDDGVFCTAWCLWSEWFENKYAHDKEFREAVDKVALDDATESEDDDGDG